MSTVSDAKGRSAAVASARRSHARWVVAGLDVGVRVAARPAEVAPRRELGEVAPYITQLALYRAVLSRLYPDKAVRAALVFTEGPRLIEIPGAAMESYGFPSTPSTTANHFLPTFAAYATCVPSSLKDKAFVPS